MEARRLLEERGADLVLETGGAETFARSVKAAAIGGTVFVIGFLTGARSTIDILPVMKKELGPLGNNTGPVAALAAAASTTATHRLVPVIDRTFEMADAPAAYAHLARGWQHFGRLRLRAYDQVAIRSLRKGSFGTHRKARERPRWAHCWRTDLRLELAERGMTGSEART